MSVDKKRFDCSALPKGWQREEITRKTGLSAGRVDVSYYSPEGERIATKPQLLRATSDFIDLTTFDFRSGQFNILSKRPRKQPKPPTTPAPPPQTPSPSVTPTTVASTGTSSSNNTGTSSSFDFRNNMRVDTCLVPPIRQTASIFKQPVTIYKTQESKVKPDFKHGPQEKPRQLFWEKRLEGLKVSNIEGESLDSMDLPEVIKPVGPTVTQDTSVRSLATSLHVAGHPITGQANIKGSLDKNPGVHTNPDQPLIQAISISDEDIRQQEERVNQSRKRLQEVLNSFT